MIRRHPLLAYFTLVYGASAVALAILGLPRTDAGAVQNPASIAVFPPLVASVAAAGLFMTWITGGRPALRELVGRMSPRRIPPPALLLVFVPAAAVLATLFTFAAIDSRSFLPGLQLFGLPIGVVAGFLEEIGWTGFAFPRMRAVFGAPRAAVLLGFLWGLWHLPVVDSLGAASPHRAAWPAFFLAFVALVAAVRSLICWAYVRTGSLLLAQLTHAGFTGLLVVFSAPHVNAWQEAVWYAGCAAVMWVVVGALAATSARRTQSRRARGRELPGSP